MINNAVSQTNTVKINKYFNKLLKNKSKLRKFTYFCALFFKKILKRWQRKRKKTLRQINVLKMK